MSAAETLTPVAPRAVQAHSAPLAHARRARSAAQLSVCPAHLNRGSEDTQTSPGPRLWSLARRRGSEQHSGRRGASRDLSPW